MHKGSIQGRKEIITRLVDLPDEAKGEEQSCRLVKRNLLHLNRAITFSSCHGERSILETKKYLEMKVRTNKPEGGGPK